jgi:hypothetical protein
MALTTTTASAAIGASDTSIVVAAATGFAAGSYVQVDNEFMQVAGGYNGTATTVPVLRGVNGTAALAHPVTCNVTVGTGSDFANPNLSVVTAYALSARRRRVDSYTASGAISIPVAGEDVVAILNSTGTLAMTVVNPTKDIDGSILYILGNGKSASTIDFDDTVGIQGAGSVYDTITFQNGAQGSFVVIACNGAWLQMAPPITGTTTLITVAVS